MIELLTYIIVDQNEQESKLLKESLNKNHSLINKANANEQSSIFIKMKN